MSIYQLSIATRGKCDDRLLITGKLILPIITLLCGIVIMFAMDNYTGFWKDELYQTLCVSRYEEAPLGLLTFYIGHLWTDHFGFTILNLRYLTSFESLLAVGVTSLYLYSRNRNIVLACASFVLGCLLLKLFAFKLYNWDSGTYLFDAVACCLLLSMISRPNLFKATFLGLVIGLMTLGRTPSGIFLIFSIILIVLNARQRKVGVPRLIITVGAVFLGWCVSMILGSTLIVGSPVKYLGLFNEGHIVSGHSPIGDKGYLFNRIQAILNMTPLKWSFGITCLFLAIFVPLIRNKLIKVILVFSLVFFCLISTYTASGNIPLYLGGDTSIGLGFLLALPIYSLFKKRTINFGKRLELWAIILMLISMAFGSDAYVERMTCGFLLPVIILVVWQIKDYSFHRFVKYFFCICLGVCSAMFVIQVCTINFIIKNRPQVHHLSLSPFRGITAEFDESELKKLQYAIPYLRENNMKFAVISPHHQIELVYGPSDGLSFHKFQQELFYKEDWNRYKDSIIPNVDAFVYPSDSPEVDEKIFLSDLNAAGFTHSLRMGDAIIVFKETSLLSAN